MRQGARKVSPSASVHYPPKIMRSVAESEDGVQQAVAMAILRVQAFPDPKQASPPLRFGSRSPEVVSTAPCPHRY